MTPANTGRYGPSGLLPSEAFSQRFRARHAERQRARTPFGPWSLNIPEAQTGVLDFDRFPYQREPYLESGDLDEMIVAKGTQVGFSTMMLRWALWIADEWGGTVMYVMPVKGDVYDFSDQRVAPVIRGSDYLRSRMAHDDPDNKGLRKIGRGFVYFRGSTKAHDLDSVPATAMVLDEYDTLSQVNIPVAEARVGAADHPMIRRIGVPTLDGVGIHAQYELTDMRRWVVRCDGCNHWQQVTMENLDWTERSPGRYKARRVCERCRRPLDVKRGEWVAEHPDREVRGYHVPRLIVPGADMGKIVANSRSDKAEVLEAHHHRDLAMPWEREDARLSRAAIESSKRQGIELEESYVGYNPVTMGIDQSSVRGLNVRISEHLNEREKRLLWIGVVDDDAPGAEGEARHGALRKLADKMQRYNVTMAAIDGAPDGRFARAFCMAHYGRAYMVHYSDTMKQSITIPDEDKVGEVDVTAKRTEWIDATLDLFRWQRNLIPRRPLEEYSEDLASYEEQLRAPVRRKVEKPDGTIVHRYEKAGKYDDWAHAEVYDVIATEILRRRIVRRHVDAAVNAEQEVQAEVPTANFNDWEGKPWEDEYRAGGASADPDDWDDDYRP
jgi:hypothetical protein